MQNYKDLKVWKVSHELTLSIYRESYSFPKEELYGLVSQLRRAASSIPANIAEGCGKKSSLDFANFLNISLGSANETEYFILLSKDLNYISEEQFNYLTDIINQIKAMLISLIKKVRTNVVLKT
jgi:four helix bundle protein